jgi:nitrite reductase/ring-hydroxylating ferredoxin subunit
MKKFFVCYMDDLSKTGQIIRYFDKIRDELILFKDANNNLKCFSSVCPHLAGEIIYKDCKLKCKWHGLEYDEKGSSLNGKVKLHLNEYGVENVNNQIYVYEK